MVLTASGEILRLGLDRVPLVGATADGGVCGESPLLHAADPAAIAGVVAGAEAALPSSLSSLSSGTLLGSQPRLLHLSPALGGGCFNTSAEDAIIERWVDGIKDTEMWRQALRLLALALIENLVYIVAIIVFVRFWQVVSPRWRSLPGGGGGRGGGGAGHASWWPAWCCGGGGGAAAAAAAGETATGDGGDSETRAATVSALTITSAIALSSWGKALLLLLMVWDYANDMVHVVNFVVVSSNAAAVHALLQRGDVPSRAVSACLVLVPFGVRTLMQMAVAYAIGMPVVFSTDWTPW